LGGMSLRLRKWAVRGPARCVDFIQVSGFVLPKIGA
jgi:hypothetical protein